MSVRDKIRDLRATAKHLAASTAMDPAPLLDCEACLTDVQQLEVEVASLRRAVEKRRPVGLEKFIEVYDKATAVEKAAVKRMLLAHEARSSFAEVMPPAFGSIAARATR